MWDEGLEALQRYVGHKGHARPKSLHTEDGFQLGQWVMNRRIDKRLGRLDRERSRVLEAFPGWSWQARDEGWEKGFALLLQFANRESHARPATNHIEDGFPLGDWVLRQRSRHGKGLRDGKQREQRLESLSGWVWNSLDARWDGALAVLKRFVAREGHARVPQGVIEGGFRLGSWVGNQRERYRAGKLDADRQRKLEELQGWTWEPYEVRWEEAFALLVRYAEREGHARIPQSHREDVLKLGTWVATQRNAYRAGKLDADRKRRLEGLPGWSWGPTGQRDGAAT
jgi:Helicase associated domain.